MVIFDSIASGLLAVHLFAAIFTLAGSALGVYFIFLKRKPDWEFGNLAALLGAGGYLFTWIMGLLIYPVFRVGVRAANFDPNVPWATGIFEMKEHIGSVGLVAAFGLVFAAFFLDKSPESRKAYGLMLAALFMITLFEAIVGLVLVGVDSI